MKLPLTISLLASNRIATLERCLDSLRPLLQQVPAELIVVFTGIDERVRQVAERYTDHIISFTWCNDFSAARNAGLKQAKGEWFLYLDDDEWFDDVEEICEFFRNGDWQRYQLASYIQRNYLNWEGSRHADAVVYRMARKSPQLHFENPIHEELAPCFSPCKNFSSYVHHYGYLGKAPGKTDGKASRNIPLLLEDISKRPDYTKNYVQLAQEYISEGKWDEAEKMCRKGHDICGGKEKFLKGWLQMTLVEILYKKKAFRQAKEEALLIFENEKPVELVRLRLFELLIGICEEWKDYEKLLEYGIQFETLLAYMERHPDLWVRQQLGTMCRDKVMQPEYLYPVRLNCVKASLELENLKEAEYFLSLLPWEDEILFQGYYPLLEQWKEAYTPHLLQLLAKLPRGSSYLLFQKVLYEEQNKEVNDDTNSFLFQRCLREIDQPYLQRQLIKKALLEKRELSALLERIDLETWKAHVSGIVDTFSYEENQTLWEAEESLFVKHPLQGLWLKKLLLEKALVRSFPMKETLLNTLKDYAGCIQDFYQRQYQKKMFEGDLRQLLPADCRMALSILEALENWSAGRLAETVRLFRQTIQINPQMTGVIREALRLLKNEMSHPTPSAGSEFDQLSIQMKDALKAMIENKQYVEAMSVLSQLFPLLPNDMEILRMQQKLLNNL
ncbi:MAG: glycosyltransferase [Lachnospiraceae bacterium]|jgi:glycosyltransferase involved in cell wall biosynthesis|nr:glycosyltransferase [Lachnospiraceae bacterium]